MMYKKWKAKTHAFYLLNKKEEGGGEKKDLLLILEDYGKRRK